MVAANGGVLSLVGETESVGRLTAPYRASSFLFVPGAMLDAPPEAEGLLVFVELK
jgi:hypothetical protein